jgi:hypothetical protein
MVARKVRDSNVGPRIGLAALAQTASEKPSLDTRRVGMRLACQCGCKDSVATCSMLECRFSKPAKERIARMQAVGMSDQQIIDAFVRDYGPGIYLAPPSAGGGRPVCRRSARFGGDLVVYSKRYRSPIAALPKWERSKSTTRRCRNTRTRSKRIWPK